MAKRLFETDDIARCYQQYRVDYASNTEFDGEIISFLREKLSGDANSTAVDVACGTGFLTRVLARHFPRVIGVDCSETQIKSARENTPHENIEYRAVGSPLTIDSNSICRRSKKMKGSSSQREICRREPEIVESMIEGSQMGLDECQYQLRFSKWNCSTAQNSVGRVLKKDTRETALVNALTSAGATYALTQACSMGALNQCGCAERPRKKKTKKKGDGAEGTWEWGGCGDDIDFGYSKSREFVDVPHKKRSDIRTLITLHNNEAGRALIKFNMFRDCKCHGLSGSCTLQTCWRKMPSFRRVGDLLKEKFDGAAKVMGGNTGEAIIPEDATIKSPTVADLVYSTDSPDFCRPNRKVGSLGTEGRRCNGSALDAGGCDILCCGRGATEHRVRRLEPCRCRFHWCCDVECDTCERIQVIHICNGY